MNYRFDLTTPKYRMRTRGVAQRIHLEHCSVAVAFDTVLAMMGDKIRNDVKTIVVGMIPFDTKKKAVFYVPEEVEFSTNPLTLHPSSNEKRNVFEIRYTNSPSYRESVTKVLKRTKSGLPEKGELACQVAVDSNLPIDIDFIYARLCIRNSNVYIYRIDLSSGHPSTVLLEASPEFVLGSDRRNLCSAPLASSMPRAKDA